MDSNFELWRQNLHLVTLALDLPDVLVKDLSGSDCKRPKDFYVLAQIMLSSLSDRPRAIAVAAGLPEDITPFRMLSRLTKHYKPVLAFNDLALRREFYQLRFQQFGAIDLISAAIQSIAAKISEIEKMKMEKLKIDPSFISDRDMIAVLIGTLPPEYDPEVKIIERESKITFEMAVKELRSREIKLQQAANGSGMRFESEAVNAMGNSSAQKCAHCHKNGHSIENCYILHPELRNQSGRGRDVEMIGVEAGDQADRRHIHRKIRRIHCFIWMMNKFYMHPPQLEKKKSTHWRMRDKIQMRTLRRRSSLILDAVVMLLEEISKNISWRGLILVQ